MRNGLVTGHAKCAGQTLGWLDLEELRLNHVQLICYLLRGMMADRHVVRIELPSSFELLDLVQILSDRMTNLAGMGEDAMHWVSVAVRESVINAIKHGNKEDRHKHVTVEFGLTPREKPAEFFVEVLDEGEGFDPDEVANPLAAENVLKSSGRGIFFMRSFMDDVTMTRRPQGGMSVRMRKTLG